MKKLLTVFTAATLFAACTPTTTKTKKASSVKTQLTLGNQKLVASESFQNEINALAKQFEAFPQDVKVATDNLAIAEVLLEAGVNLVALPEFPDTLESSEIKFNTQTFNPIKYSCGDFDNQEVKQEGGENVCYIDGEKSELIKPVQNVRYGSIDTKAYYNLGYANQIDKDQLIKSEALIFISTNDDFVTSKFKNIKNVTLDSFNSPEDIYKFAEALSTTIANDASFASTYQYDLYKSYKVAAELQEKANSVPVGTIQFVYVDSKDNVYASTNQSFGYKLGQRFGFDKDIVGTTQAIKKDYDFEIVSNTVGELITSSDQITGDVLFVITASQWGKNTAIHSYVKEITGSKAFKAGNVLFLDDSQFVSKDTATTIKEIVAKVYDK